MGMTAEEVDLGVVQCVKCGTLEIIWRYYENDFVKRLYESRTEECQV